MKEANDVALVQVKTEAEQEARLRALIMGTDSLSGPGFSSFFSPDQKAVKVTRGPSSMGRAG